MILADQTTRDRASTQTKLSIALAAGAGSGKTSVLVARVIEILLAGTRPERIAAITFTVKAAGELVERVRDRLEDEFAKAEGARRATLAETLAGLPRMTLSTIHSFCQDLLSAEALEAGWAPGTEVLGDAYAPSSVDAAFRAWRADLNHRAPALVLDFRRNAELGEFVLREAAMRFIANRDLVPVIGPKEPDFGPAVRELLAIREELLSAATACLRPGTCKLYLKNADLVASVGRLGSPDDAKRLVEIALKLPKSNIQGGGKADWPGESKSRFVAAVKALRVWQEVTPRIYLGPIHRALMIEFRDQLLPRVDAHKQQASQVDFQDLLVHTRTLLETRDGARRRLAGRFDAILVDEVQDTDPIQSAIVCLLARAPDQSGAWNAHPPLPGKVFAVGDPKQSIYRFRRADVRQWRALEDVITAQGEKGSLSSNFRSVPGIVGFINHAFSTLPDYEPLVATRAPAALDPVVMLVDRVEDPSDAVARYLAELHASDARVVDRETRALRPVRWGDVMVLIPSWTQADKLQGRLVAAGIPSVLEGGRSFFERDEVRLCIAALHALDEPGHAEAIVQVLRGLFGISLAELADYRARGGTWRYTIPPAANDSAIGPIPKALKLLARLRRQRAQRSWVALLDELLDATGASAVWAMLARGPAMLANVDKLRAVVRSLEPHAKSGSALIAALKEISGKPDEDLPLAAADSDVVRITTYFKAKGLEAPVVILAHSKRHPPTIEHVVDHERGELRMRIGKDLCPPGWDDAVAAEKAALTDERRRWMYVAATRARDQLVIVRGDDPYLLAPDLANALPEPGDGSAGDDYIHEITANIAVRVREVDTLTPAPESSETFPGRDAEIDALLAAETATDDPGPAWFALRKRRVAAARQQSAQWRSVTELVRAKRTPTEGGRRGGAEVGLVVHLVMECLRYDAPLADRVAEAERLAGVFAVDANLDQHLTEIAIAIASRIAAHPIVERAGAAPECWREVPFAYPRADGVVRGTIDLVFPVDTTRKRWVVVDWKSSLPKLGTEARLAYEAQLKYYARAIIENINGVAPEDIEEILVGPHQELEVLPDPAWTDAFEYADPTLTDLLVSLRAAGAPAPDVGGDIGEPSIASDVELVWREARVALDADPEQVATLRAAGWTVFELSSDDAPARELVAQLAAALGVIVSD